MRNYNILFQNLYHVPLNDNKEIKGKKIEQDYCYQKLVIHRKCLQKYDLIHLFIHCVLDINGLNVSRTFTNSKRFLAVHRIEFDPIGISSDLPSIIYYNC